MEKQTEPVTKTTRSFRESTSTKLKWNMLLQQPMSRVQPGVPSIATPRSATPDLRIPSPPTIAREHDTHPDNAMVAAELMEKKSSIDSTASSGSSTLDNLRNSLGFDWKIIGQPSGGAESNPGHSRERALSLLERVSNSQLSEDNDDLNSGHSYSARNVTGGSSVFSPFESGFDIRVSGDEMLPMDSYHPRSSISRPSSRSSSPSIQMMPQYQPQPYYVPQMNPYASESLRRQNMLEGVADWSNTAPNDYLNSRPHHRASVSYGNGHSLRSAGSLVPSIHRQSMSPAANPPMSAYPSFPSRRSSVPHRAFASNELEVDMSSMALHSDYYEPVSLHQQQYSYHQQQHFQQQQHQQFYQQQQFMQYPYNNYNVNHHQMQQHQVIHHPLPAPPLPQSFYDQVPSSSSSPSLTSTTLNTALADSVSKATSSSPQFQMSSYRGPLYAVEFKAGRTEVFYVLEGPDGLPLFKISPGDLVIVEADRGEDLGKITCSISIDRLKQLMSLTNDVACNDDIDALVGTVEAELAPILYAKEIVPKRIHRLATPDDLKMVQAKGQEEAIAMVRCQSRIRQKRLPMEVVDAEYQWDRNKLTFFFQSDKRIDFRELVRDLFRIYKTRIWMCAVDKLRLAALAEMRKNTSQDAIDAVKAAALAADRECEDSSFHSDLS